MAENKLLKTFNELPSWSKGVLAVGGVLIAWVIYSRIRNSLKKDESLMESIKAASDLASLGKQGIKPTITTTQAQGFVNTILSAASDFGTDEDAIYRVFNNLNNEADLYLLIKEFDVRKWKGTFTAFFSNESGGLSYLLSYELSSDEIQKINNILKSKGINYKF